MTIDDWRRKVDEIDRKLVELLNDRARCVAVIGRLKRVARLPLHQPEREGEILENVERANHGPLPGAVLRRLFERILHESRAIERAAMREEPDDAARKS